MLLLLAATAAHAQVVGGEGESLSAADLARIDWLVGKLSARDSFLRTAAQRELARYGRRVAPVLRGYDPEQPETRARIDGVLRLFERIELTARLVARIHAVGAPVAIRMRLTNHTRQPHVLPLQLGPLTPFRISIAGDGRFLKRSELTYSPQQRQQVVTLQPGQSIVAEVAIDPTELPRGTRGTISILASYTSEHALRLANAQPKDEEGVVVEGDAVTLALIAPTLEVDIRSRTIEQLEAALGVEADRQRALIEVRFRDDDEILPLLRRHARDENLRLHAIRVLGAKGDVEDLDIIRLATKDPVQPVRQAATLALGNFDHRKARSMLRGLAGDAELGLSAVTALTKHREARTIDTFILLLRNRFSEGERGAVIRKALLKWTDKTVPNRPSEVAAFERWWKANRADWIQRNAKR